MHKVLTIIIPTYNMERFLRRCLDSLIIDEESMKLLEVLVVNDGSKDSSSQIAHGYQNKYPDTFKVIDKENGNYGSCINRGLKEASGKYVKILDSDDWFDNECFVKFLHILSTIDVDFILSDYNVINVNGLIISEIRYDDQGIHPWEVRKIKDIMEIRPTFVGAMHGFAYRRKILIDMEYKQSEGLSYTDQEWVDIPFTKVRTYYYCPFALYQYLLGREGQTMDKKIKSKSINQLMQVSLNIVNFIQYGEYSRQLFKNYLINQLLIQLNYIYKSSICENIYPNQQLVDFDKLLSSYTSIINLTNDFHYAKYKYVKDWRDNHCIQLSLIGRLFMMIYKCKNMISWGGR